MKSNLIALRCVAQATRHGGNQEDQRKFYGIFLAKKNALAFFSGRQTERGRSPLAVPFEMHPTLKKVIAPE